MSVQVNEEHGRLEDDAVDVQACVREGRPVRPHGPYRIAVGNDRLEFVQTVIHDPVPSGRQVLLEGGFKPVEEHLVFQMLRNGELEELRLDATTDLRSAGVEKFLVFRSDRSFRFELDGTRQEWGGPLISGATLKKLAGVDLATYGVWQEVRQHGAEDRLIANDELVDLAAPGVEWFFTGLMQTTEG